MDKRILEMCREIDAAKLATAQEGVTAWAENLQDELLAEKEWVTQLTKTTARLEKFLINAQKDAVRYLWLRARPVEDCTTPRIEVNVWTCNVTNDGVSDSVNDGEVLAGDALDAAIDAAMKECGK